MKTCVIFNPAARGERARRFRKFLESVPGGAALQPTQAPGHATELAANAVAQGFENVVAAGGDGTLNEVLNGLVQAPDGLERARLGVLPLGTVNVFAKELGIPEQPEKAWQTVLAGHDRTIDLPYAESELDGRPQRRYFAQLAGAGLDAAAIELVDWESKRRFRQLAYVYAGMRALLRPQSRIEARAADAAHAEAEAEADRDTGVVGELVLVGNGKFYGGRLKVFPDASLEDGMLDVCVFPKVSLWTAAKFGVSLFLGRNKVPSPIRYFQTRELRLTSSTGAKFELEGDLIGPVPVVMGLLPRALRVICPQSA